MGEVTPVCRSEASGSLPDSPGGLEGFRKPHTLQTGVTPPIRPSKLSERFGRPTPVEIPVEIPVEFPVEIPVEIPLEILEILEIAVEIPMEIPAESVMGFFHYAVERENKSIAFPLFFFIFVSWCVLALLGHMLGHVCAEGGPEW